MWINRTIETLLGSSDSALRSFPVVLLLGPRQVGKSSLLKLLGVGRRFVDLDDLAVRAQIHSDPILFAEGLRAPLIVDEIQYAPVLLSAVKRLADAGAEPNSIWLTGSQSFEVMKGVRETLAGRVAILNLFGLTDEEKGLQSVTPEDYFQSIFESSFPKLFHELSSDVRELYLSSYLQTYIERDVRELLGIQKRREFELFVRACALRTGQLINFDDLGKTVGISANTAKDWVSVLEDSFLLKIVHPWFTNRSKRIVKTPKLYFLDMGLAAYLAGWKTWQMLFLGAMRGAAFETHVFSTLHRFLRHRGMDANIHFLRTRDGMEIDFIVETTKGIFPIETKAGTPNAKELPNLEKFADAQWRRGSVLSLQLVQRQESAELSREWIARSPLDLAFLTD